MFLGLLMQPVKIFFVHGSSRTELNISPSSSTPFLSSRRKKGKHGFWKEKDRGELILSEYNEQSAAKTDDRERCSSTGGRGGGQKLAAAATTHCTQ